MCVLCAAAVEKYFPMTSSFEQHALLWNATAFPFGDGKYIANQLATKRHQIDSLKKRPGFWPRFDSQGIPLSDVEIAMCIADAETYAVMKARDA